MLKILFSEYQPYTSFVGRKSWVQRIRKISEVDPLTCSKCQGRMHVMVFIEDDNVIHKVHLQRIEFILFLTHKLPLAILKYLVEESL